MDLLRAVFRHDRPARREQAVPADEFARRMEDGERRLRSLAEQVAVIQRSEFPEGGNGGLASRD